MSGLCRIAKIVALTFAIIGGGVFGAVALAAFGVWLTPISGDPKYPGPGDGLVLLGPIALGVLFGFPGGAILATWLWARTFIWEPRQNSQSK